MSAGKFIFLLAWPLLGAGFCIFIAAYSVPTSDLTTNVVGIGSIAIGIVRPTVNAGLPRTKPAVH